MNFCFKATFDSPSREKTHFYRASTASKSPTVCGINACPETYSRGIFFYKIRFSEICFQTKQNFDRFQLGISEFFGEFFNQSRSTTPLNLRVKMDNQTFYNNRRSLKGFLPIT